MLRVNVFFVLECQGRVAISKIPTQPIFYFVYLLLYLI